MRYLWFLLLLVPFSADAETRPPQYTWTGPTVFVDGSPLSFVEIVRFQVQCSNDDFVTIVVDEIWLNDIEITPTGVPDQYVRNGDTGLPNSSMHVCRHRAAVEDPVTGLLWGDYAFSPPFKIRGKPGKSVVDKVQ